MIIPDPRNISEVTLSVSPFRVMWSRHSRVISESAKPRSHLSLRGSNFYRLYTIVKFAYLGDINLPPLNWTEKLRVFR